MLVLCVLRVVVTILVLEVGQVCDWKMAHYVGALVLMGQL